MKITQAQKRKIARLVAEKAAALENDTIHVWQNNNDFSLTIGSWEHRDGKHKLVASIDIRNEGHPYTQAGVMRVLEFQGV